MQVFQESVCACVYVLTRVLKRNCKENRIAEKRTSLCTS